MFQGSLESALFCLVRRDGSLLGDRKRLAAMIAPQVQLMVRDEGDGKSVLVATETRNHISRRLCDQLASANYWFTAAACGIRSEDEQRRLTAPRGLVPVRNHSDEAYALQGVRL